MAFTRWGLGQVYGPTLEQLQAPVTVVAQDLYAQQVGQGASTSNYLPWLIGGGLLLVLLMGRR